MTKFAFLTVLCTASTALALQPPAESADDLSAKATDPTASLMSLTLQGNYTGAYYGDAVSLDDDALQFKFQAAIPFKLLDVPNLFRVGVPYQASGRGEEGLGTLTLLDVFLIQQDWGRIATGPLLNIDTTGDQADRITGGVSLGAVIPLSKRLNVGIFSQNLFGDETALTQIQPIIAYQLGEGWSVSGGDLQFTYDWEAGRWTNAPVGIQLGKVLKIGTQPVRLSLNPQYNLLKRDGLNEWSCTFGVSFLLPSF